MLTFSITSYKRGRNLLLNDTLKNLYLQYLGVWVDTLLPVAADVKICLIS